MLSALVGNIRVRALGTVALCLAVFQPVPAAAQNLPTETIQRMLQERQGEVADQADPLRSTSQVLRPAVPVQPLPASRLEQLYSARAGRPLEQFGYSFLGRGGNVQLNQTGAIQDSYVVGVGDEIVVVLRGQENATYRQRVNRDGQIILPRLPPIAAAGRGFSSFRGEVEAQVGQAYVATDAYVSLGEIRQVSVLVTGEVAAPGVRNLSALATPLDALLLSGGIAKTGSLRHVTIVRGGSVTKIDLYGVVTQGNGASLGTLREGDRIVVPPLGDTVAIAGLVRRPGIYELGPGAAEPKLDELIALAGGVEIAGAYRLSKMQLDADGTTRLVAMANTGTARSGEIVFVDSSRDGALERVTLSGAVRLPGTLPLSTVPTIGRLLRSADLRPEAYTAFAVIVRRDPTLNVKTLEPFSLATVLRGGGDLALSGDDTVYVFSRDQIRLLSDAAARERDQSLPGNLGAPVNPAWPATNGAAPDAAQSAFGGDGTAPDAAQSAFGGDGTAPDARLRAAGQEVTAGTEAVAEAAELAQRQRALPSLALAGLGQAERDAASVETLARQLGVSVAAVVRTAADHLVWLVDEVRDPGAYLGANGVTLAEMIQTAGGLLRQADLSSVEVTSTSIDQGAGTSRTVRTVYRGTPDDFQRVLVLPLDVIRLRPVFSDRDQGRVTISGQVRYPGSFDITRAERLSAVLERAGGLTDESYAYGAIFTRRRAAVAEREANGREARALEAQLATLASSNAAEDRGRVTFLAGLTGQLRDAPTLGRIMVTADPAVLKVRPELDIILEPGDTLYIPKRPSTVTVSGEVLSTGSFQYQAGLGVRDYLSLAGGTTREADSGRIFILLPDGSAQLARQSWLSYGNMDLIPPGSTIIVPRNLQPFNIPQFLRDATQIVSQLAISAASIAVIGR